MKYLRVAKFREYQHYRDRSPAWIKLHSQIFTSRTWVMLDDDQARLLMIVCMLLASLTDNRIPLDVAYIRRVARLHQDPDFSELLKLGFLEVIGETGRVLAGASERNQGKRPVPNPADSLLAEIWKYYIDRIGKNPKTYSLTDKRRCMGKARLDDLLHRIESEPKLEKAVSLMKLCVDRLAASSFHNGKNEQGKKYLDWEILFRSIDQMEKWLDDSRFEGVQQ